MNIITVPRSIKRTIDITFDELPITGGTVWDSRLQQDVHYRLTGLLDVHYMVSTTTQVDEIPINVYADARGRAVQPDGELGPMEVIQVSPRELGLELTLAIKDHIRNLMLEDQVSMLRERG